MMMSAAPARHHRPPFVGISVMSGRPGAVTCRPLVLVRGWASLIAHRVQRFIILMPDVLEYVAPRLMHGNLLHRGPALGRYLGRLFCETSPMIIVEREAPLTRGDQVIALFGHGLIGRSITAAIGKSKQAGRILD
jgi:hypothetical protein